MEASGRTAGTLELWHLRGDGAASGPYTLPELYRLMETGAAAPTDRAWRKGTFIQHSLAELVGEVPGHPPATTTPKAPRRNYLLRHWHGELSLGVSYWVNVVLVGLAWAGAVALLGFAMSRWRPVLNDSLQVALLLSALALVPLPVSTWQVVGAWRSGNAHVARGGRRFWAIAARVMLVLAVLRVVADYATTTIPTTANAWRLAIAMAQLPPAEFTALRGGREIEFRGGVHAGTAERLRQFLDQHPQARLLHLESPGGNLAQGRAMAALVRRRNLDTYVRGQCASACTLIFMAGRERWLRDDGRLGFHAPIAAAVGQGRDSMLAIERQRLLQSGVPEWFVTRIFAAQGTTLWVPTVEELRRARIITATTDGTGFSLGLPPVPMEAMAAEAMIRSVALGQAVETANPAEFRRLATGLRNLMDDGGTEGDWGAMLERTVGPLYRQSLSQLRDDVVVFTTQRHLDAIRELAAQDAGLCRDWLLRRSPERTMFETPGLTTAHRVALFQVMAEVLIFGTNPALRAAPPAQAPPHLAAVYRLLAARLPRAQAMVLENLDGAHPPALVCAAVTELFTEILRLPEREAGPVLRFLFANS